MTNVEIDGYYFHPDTYIAEWEGRPRCLTVALTYAARGWEIFPAPPGEKKSHKKADYSDGKEWGKTTDPKEIKRNWKKWPNAAIGIATGRGSGVFVVEADTAEGHDVDGIAELAKLEARYGKLPDTLMAESPSGSIHRYFKYPKDVEKIKTGTSEIAEGVDVRGDGGMVIAPPSVRPGRGCYSWINNLEPADAPPWLIDLCSAPHRPRTPATGSHDRTSAPRTSTGMKIFLSILDDPPTQPFLSSLSQDPDDYLWPPTLEDIEETLSIIPNNMNRDEWNNVGMAAWLASGGEAKDAFVTFSKKSPVHATDQTDGLTPERRWEHYYSSPPTATGFDKLCALAWDADPTWLPPSWRARAAAFESGGARGAAAPAIKKPAAPAARPFATLAPLPPTPRSIVELNELYAVVTIGSNVRVMAMKESPPVFYRIGDFKVLLLNRTHGAGKNAVPLANWWLSHPDRRQYSGVVFESGRAETVNGCRNLWTGFAVEPQEGDCGLYLDFLLKVICSGNEEHYKYLLDLMADTVKHPNKQGEIAVVLMGVEGIGKGFAINHFGYLFGPHFLPVTQASHVVGKFNGHLGQCSVLFGDEAFFAGDRQHEAVLKGLITEPAFMVERKGIDAIRARNLTHLWISSNENWVVPAGPTARRFFCLNVSNSQRNKHDYFRKIDDQMCNGGYAALLHMLLTRNLTGVEVRSVPETGALAEQKALTRRGVDALVEWICDQGFLPCTRKDRHDVAITSDSDPNCKETFYTVAKKQISSLQYLTPTTITRTLKDEWGCTSWCVHGRRGIVFPPLEEMRERFIARHGPTEWSSSNTVWDAPDSDKNTPM
jgi:Bifunctional DNA primase/polymerase, N-terminal/Family of unknown function (DUF5906)/Primase C terminal 2 (PriCT-2)